MIYMFLAEGFEEVEALAPLDIIRRAGLEIKGLGKEAETVECKYQKGGEAEPTRHSG